VDDVSEENIIRIITLEASLLFAFTLLLGLFDPEDGAERFLRNVPFNALQDVISRKIELFITTAE
jgi:hypothetical protein